VSTDRVLHPSLAEFNISADENGLMFYGPHGQFVIFGACEARRTCRPTLMPMAPQHASHRGIYVMIKEESH
jgi:hypothetical protein